MTDEHFFKLVKSYLRLPADATHRDAAIVLAADQFFISRMCEHFDALQKALGLPEDAIGSEIVAEVVSLMQSGLLEP